MSLVDRDIYLRNHILSVLVSHSGKGLSYTNIAGLADDITDAVMEGDRKWQEAALCEQYSDLQEDITQ